jgi:hypothetical protein
MARIRSPNYPALSLPEAIKAVTTIQAKEQHLAAPKEVVAKHVGYASLHGLAGRVISAIEKYGLLEEVNGDKVKVSSLAMSILFPATPEEKHAAIKEAAFKPPLFAAIKEEWQGAQPSDENLRVYLVRKKFGADALDRVIEVYKDTMNLVTPESGEYDILNSGQSGQTQEKPAMQTQHVDTSGRGRKGGEVEPFRVTYSPSGIEVSGRITDIESAEHFIATVEALKRMLPKASARSEDNEAAT